MDAMDNKENTGCYKALIADDHEPAAKLLALSLSLQPKIGQIECVDSGAKAIEKATAEDYDIILLDVMMPEMDGYEVCEQLRKIPKYKTAPIVMVTGMTSPLDEARAIIAGSTTYVTKPVQQANFKKIIDREILMIDHRKKIQGTSQ